MDRLILKFIQEGKGLRTAKAILEKNNAGRLTPPGYKTSDTAYYTATEIKTAWYWDKDRNIYIYIYIYNRNKDQWSRIESPEINIYIYNQLIFNKGDKTSG